MSTSVAVTIGLLVGVLLGAVVGVAAARRRPPAVAPPVAPRSDDLAPILAALRSSAVLLDGDLTVLHANPSAYAYGLVRAGDLTQPELGSLAAAAHDDGRVHELVVTVQPEGDREPPTRLAVRASGLSDGRVLLQALDRARVHRSEEARRDFVANVSHELKTPVGAIRLLSEAIGDAADDPAAVGRFAEQLQRETVRLSKLVTELLELSRLQLDNPVEGANAVDLDAVVAEAMDRCTAAAELKDIEIVRGGPHGLHLIGDRAMLVTALVNLLENAVAYSPEHTRVAVGVRARDDTVELTVTDQGIGIPEDEVDRIFERFYRVDPARSRQTGGTGLGLSIVKHIVAAHRGEVSVWSSPGAGSTFTIRLPLHPTEDVEASGPTSRSTPQREKV